MTNKAVFLDRDDTINKDPGYLGDPDKVELIEGVAEGLKKLKDDLGFKIIVISNQSGISRGLITDTQVKEVNAKIKLLLEQKSATIDAFYYCPHHPEFSNEEETKCRKPSPYMIKQAAKDYSVDLKKSYMIGDRKSDVESGINAGTKTILLNANKDEAQIIYLKKAGKTPNFVANNFLEAVSFIYNDIKGE